MDSSQRRYNQEGKLSHHKRQTSVKGEMWHPQTYRGKGSEEIHSYRSVPWGSKCRDQGRDTDRAVGPGRTYQDCRLNDIHHDGEHDNRIGSDRLRTYGFEAGEQPDKDPHGGGWGGGLFVRKVSSLSSF